MALYTVKALDSVDWKERPIKFIFASDEENLHMRSDAKEIFAEEAAGALAAFNFETGYMDNSLFVVGPQRRRPVSIKIHGRASHSRALHREKGRSAVLEAAHKIVEIESQNDIMRGRLMNCGMVDGGIMVRTPFRTRVRCASASVSRMRRCATRFRNPPASCDRSQLGAGYDGRTRSEPRHAVHGYDRRRYGAVPSFAVHRAGLRLR